MIETKKVESVVEVKKIPHTIVQPKKLEPTTLVRSIKKSLTQTEISVAKQRKLEQIQTTSHPNIVIEKDEVIVGSSNSNSPATIQQEHQNLFKTDSTTTEVDMEIEVPIQNQIMENRLTESEIVRQEVVQMTEIQATQIQNIEIAAENQQIAENQDQLDPNTNILNNNNFMVDEDGNIVVRDINLTDENGQQIEINLQELLQHSIDDSNIILQQDEHGNLINIENAPIQIQGEDMQNFIFQTAEGGAMQEIMSENSQEQVVNVQTIPLEEWQLINGDANVQNYTIQSESTSQSQEVVLEEVVVDNLAEQESNKQTLDESSDILKEVAAQAEKPATPTAQKRPAPGMKSNHLVKKSPKIEGNDSNHLRNFSQAYEFFIDSTKKNIGKK